MFFPRISHVLCAAALLAGTLRAATAASSQSGAAGDQQTFATPRAAADALLEACKNNDSPALIRMLGDRYGKNLERIDDAEERQHRRDFYEKAQTQLKIEEQGDAKAVLVIGREEFPIPIPLVKEAKGWRFDTDAGLEELQMRRVGANELAVIDALLEFTRLQREYAAQDRDGDEVREYAQRLASTPGRRDGLFWERREGEPPSPLEALLPDHFSDLRNSAPGVPYMGYHFKILTRQGAHPPGGAYDYIINGNMIAGCALVAWPADYRHSGVMTFVTSHQGKLLEKDLGPDSAKLAAAMTEYNPDETWTPVKAWQPE